MKKYKNYTFLIFWLLAGLNVLAWQSLWGLGGPELLEINFFDVGQGDAIFIETPQGHQILIDGGPGSIILEKLAREMPFWDRSLDLIVLTHPEHDHLLGLIEVLKRYKVNSILWTGLKRDTQEYAQWLKLIENEGAEILFAKTGQRLGVGKTYFEILYPFENLNGQETENSNNTSIVTKLVFNENSFLFTGDIYISTEKKLIQREKSLKADVLKVGHHGSKTSNSEEFIKKVLPEVAIISVGGNKNAAGRDCDNKDRNRYGHPSCQLLEFLNKFGTKILRTDIGGDVKIFSDGNNLKVKTKN